MRVQLDIPEPLANVMATRAKEEGLSVDEFTMRVLARGVDVQFVALAKRDLSFMGGLSVEDAQAIEEAHAFMDQCSYIGGPEADADRP